MRRAHGRVHSFRAHLASKLHDLRINRRDLVVFGHGDTMVAIPNEVRLADLVEAHRMRGAPTYGRHRWLPGACNSVSTSGTNMCLRSEENGCKMHLRERA